jgi:hypothetical protein
LLIGLKATLHWNTRYLLIISYVLDIKNAKMWLLWGSFADKIVELHIAWCCVAPRKDRHAGTGESKREHKAEDFGISMFSLSLIDRQKAWKKKLCILPSTKT